MNAANDAWVFSRETLDKALADYTATGTAAQLRAMVTSTVVDFLNSPEAHKLRVKFSGGTPPAPPGPPAVMHRAPVPEAPLDTNASSVKRHGT